MAVSLWYYTNSTLRPSRVGKARVSLSILDNCPEGGGAGGYQVCWGKKEYKVVKREREYHGRWEECNVEKGKGKQ